MAGLRVHKTANGTRYTSRVRIRQSGKVIHEESRTFSRRALAVNWGKQREVALQKPGALAQAMNGPALVIDLIQEYLDMWPGGERTKIYDLRRLQTYTIAGFDARELNTGHLIRHIHWRLESCKPQPPASE